MYFSSMSPQSCRSQKNQIKNYVSHFVREVSCICIKINESGRPSSKLQFFFFREPEHPVQSAKGENAFGVNDSALNFNNVLFENE